MNTKETQKAIEQAADLILSLPSDQRPGWTSYFLECLDKNPDEDNLLWRISDQITDRLESGGW